MNMNEMYKEYIELLNEKYSLESMIKVFVEKSKSVELGKEKVDEEIEKCYERLKILKIKIDSLETSMNLYFDMDKSKILSDKNVRHNLKETLANAKEILSSDGKKSQSDSLVKTPNEIVEEKKR